MTNEIENKTDVKIKTCKLCLRSEGITFNGKRRVCTSCRSKKNNEKYKKLDYFKKYYVEKRWYKPKKNKGLEDESEKLLISE